MKYVYEVKNFLDLAMFSKHIVHFWDISLHEFFFVKNYNTKISPPLAIFLAFKKKI